MQCLSLSALSAVPSKGTLLHPGQRPPFLQLCFHFLRSKMAIQSRNRARNPDYLPQEVITEILYKLPTKALVQCISVCKSWYSIIKSPAFITAHLCKSRARIINGGDRLLLVGFSGEQWAVHFDTQQLEEHTQLQFPANIRGADFSVLGSCNGLVFLVHTNADNVVLWNPLVGKSFAVPKPRPVSVGWNTVCTFVYGLGFDFIGSDFKVLRIVQFDDINDQNHTEIELFSLNSGSWKTITSSIPLELGLDSIVSVDCLMPFVNGFIHCIASRRVAGDGGRFCNMILRFDVGQEEFGEISLPESLRSDQVLWDLSIDSYKESSIAVIEHDLSLSGYIRGCHIWVMKVYGAVSSWTHLWTIEPELGVTRVMEFRKNGEIIVRKEDHHGLHSWDPETNQVKELLIMGTHSIGGVFSYMESLALFNTGNVLNW